MTLQYRPSVCQLSYLHIYNDSTSSIVLTSTFCAQQLHRPQSRLSDISDVSLQWTDLMKASCSRESVLEVRTLLMVRPLSAAQRTVKTCCRQHNTFTNRQYQRFRISSVRALSAMPAAALVLAALELVAAAAAAIAAAVTVVSQRSASAAASIHYTNRSNMPQ